MTTINPTLPRLSPVSVTSEGYVPQTSVQWFRAIAQATHLLELVAEHDFGLINAECCEDILNAARAHGYITDLGVLGAPDALAVNTE